MVNLKRHRVPMKGYEVVVAVTRRGDMCEVVMEDHKGELSYIYITEQEHGSEGCIRVPDERRLSDQEWSDLAQDLVIDHMKGVFAKERGALQ